jgi:hypothetical protein
MGVERIVRARRRRGMGVVRVRCVWRRRRHRFTRGIEGDLAVSRGQGVGAC